MFINILKILILLLFLNIKPVYSKITKNTDFKTKNLSSYFSALVSYENQQNKDSLKFFNSSKSLIHFHKPYLRNYINTLVQEGKIKKAAHELRIASSENNLDFFEAYLLLFLDAIKKEDNNKISRGQLILDILNNNNIEDSLKFLSNLDRFKYNKY